MKSLVVAFLLLYGPVFLFAQTITGTVKGKVMDATTSQPISFASIYINHTTIGVSSDAQGNFELNNIPLGDHELVFSFVGYKPYYRKLTIKDATPIWTTIKLIVNELTSVTVTSKKDDKWGRQFARFSKFFFGQDHRKDCRIINPWVLDFKTSEGSYFATASDPLIIQNNYLGYRLEYVLKNFKVSQTAYNISGYIRYIELDTADNSIKEKWNANREKAYYGSMRHLMKSIIENESATNHFELYVDQRPGEEVSRNVNFLQNIGNAISAYSTDGKVTEGERHQYTIQFPQRLEVIYTGRRAKITVYRNVANPVSWIEVKGPLIVNGNGVVLNPSQMILLGQLGAVRVDELLPYDYQPKNADQTELVAGESGTSWLMEKPYIQTDKSYYYPAEDIWLKGYMNYETPILKDSLSRTVYVDLINSNKKVIATRIYAIDDRGFSGDIHLPDTLSKGNYLLRGYTSWMMNFGRQFTFEKPLKVLSNKEAARFKGNITQLFDTTHQVSIKGIKNAYAPREKITLDLETIDEAEFPVASHLSISVTDLEQAVPPGNELNIINGSAIDTRISSGSITKYPIQYGIDFRGHFELRGKPTNGVLTVFFEKQSGTFAIPTDDNGKFNESLNIFGPTNFYIKALNNKGKKGEVVMEGQRVFATTPTIEPLVLDIYSAPDHTVYVNKFTNATVLEEVVIEEKKIERSTRPGATHLFSDASIDSDWISQHTEQDILTIMQMRISGLRLHPLRFVTSGMQFPGGDQNGGEPLVILDGIVLNLSGDEIENQLLNIPVQSVERIEAMKYGSSSAYGARGASGVIAIYTKKGDYVQLKNGKPDLSKLQLVKLDGYDSAAVFPSPDYSKENNESGYSDYRSTIYWDPNVTTDGKTPTTISFYAADIPSQYRVVVEGISATGDLVRGERIINIVKQP